MNDWFADVDADEVPSGNFVPVLVLVPPAELEPPLRRRLEGEHLTAEAARFAALEAIAAMSISQPSSSDDSPQPRSR